MLFLSCFQCYFYHIFNTIFTIFSMHILPWKNVLLKINLEDFKNHFWILNMLNINLMVSPYRWRCMYNSPYWRSILAMSQNRIHIVSVKIWLYVEKNRDFFHFDLGHFRYLLDFQLTRVLVHHYQPFQFGTNNHHPW